MLNKVLVIESDRAFARDLQDELERLRYTTTIVTDGAAGLQQAAADRPDVILLAIEPGGPNGFEVCQHFKKNARLKDIPLIIISSRVSAATFEQHRKLRTRADDYVHKPIAVEALVARLQQVITRPRAEIDLAARALPVQSQGQALTRRLPALVIVGLICWGAVRTAANVVYQARARPATCTLARFDLVEEGRSFRPVWAYTLHLPDHDETAQVTFNQAEGYSDRAYAVSDTSRHNPGQSLRCWYDPQRRRGLAISNDWDPSWAFWRLWAWALPLALCALWMARRFRGRAPARAAPRWFARWFDRWVAKFGGWGWIVFTFWLVLGCDVFAAEVVSLAAARVRSGDGWPSWDVGVVALVPLLMTVAFARSPFTSAPDRSDDPPSRATMARWGLIALLLVAFGYGVVSELRGRAARSERPAFVLLDDKPFWREVPNWEASP